jgi:hypothetical protein
MDPVFFWSRDECESQLERDNVRSDDFLLDEKGQSVGRDNLRAYAFLLGEGASSETESVVFLQGEEEGENLGDSFFMDIERSIKIIPGITNSLVFFFRLLDSREQCNRSQTTGREDVVLVVILGTVYLLFHTTEKISQLNKMAGKKTSSERKTRKVARKVIIVPR